MLLYESEKCETRIIKFWDVNVSWGKDFFMLNYAHNFFHTGIILQIRMVYVNRMIA